jgi:hypothetical protein
MFAKIYSRLIVFVLLICVLGCVSCANKIKFEEPDDATIRDANESAFKKSQPASEVAGASTLWASFGEFFRTCAKSSGFPGKTIFSKYKFLYLGPTNARYLGSIYSHDGVVPKAELDWINAQDMKKFISLGVPVASCDIDGVKETFLKIALSGAVFSQSPNDTAAAFVLNNVDSIKNAVGSWTIDAINTDQFKSFLDTTENPRAKNYKESLTNPKNIFSFEVVKISGFSADLKLTHNLEADGNFEIPILRSENAVDSSKVLSTLKFQKKSNLLVHAESTGTFYVFALAMKAKKAF